MATVLKSQAEVMKKDIESVNAEINTTIRTSCKNLIHEVAENWQSPAAFKFLIYTQRTFNLLLPSIIKTLNSAAKAIVSNGNAALQMEEESSALILPAKSELFSTIDLFSEFKKGINGVEGDIKFDPDYTSGIPTKLGSIKTSLISQIGNLKTTAINNPNAFEGAGQHELVATLGKIATDVESAITKLQQHVTTATTARSEAQTQVISSLKTNFSGN